MKKIIFTIVAICLIVTGLKAQPVITYSGNASQIGDSYEFSGADGSFDPGPDGANQNWDFSGISSSYSYTVTVVSPASTPFAPDFPESNTAFHYTGDNESFSYAEITTSEMLNDGMGFDPGGSNEYIIHYTDAVKNMEYPFSYTGSYTDSYYTAYTLNGVDIHEHGNVTVTADAWGSVSTPAGVYNNTLRVKSEYTYTDSVFMMGTFISATTNSYTDYEWYTATSHTAVISISVSGDGSSVSYRSDGVGIDEQTGFQCQMYIYPNPATNRINVEFPGKMSNNTEVFICNLAGKQVVQGIKTGNKYSSDISALPSGEYIIKAGNKYVGKFIKR